MNNSRTKNTKKSLINQKSSSSKFMKNHNPPIKVNFKNHHVAFLFEAILAALTISLAFVVEDIIDHYIDKYQLQPWVKVVTHGIVIFVITLVSIYILFFIFGYGNTLIELD